jgi:hypothetical protein
MMRIQTVELFHLYMSQQRDMLCGLSKASQ